MTYRVRKKPRSWRSKRASPRDEVREGIDPDAVVDDDGNGDETVAEMLELDQTELDELGLTLDDPHQPVDE